MMPEMTATSCPSPTRLWNRVPVMVFGIIQIVGAVALMLNDIIGFIVLPHHENSISCHADDYSRTLITVRRYGSIVYTLMGSVFCVVGMFFTITGILGIKAGQRLPPGAPPSSRRRLLVSCAVMSILGAMGGGPLIAGSVINLGPSVQFGLHIVMFVANVGQAIAAGINLCKMRPKTLKMAQIVFPPPGAYPGAQALVCDHDGQPMYFVPTQPTGPTAPPQQQGTDVGQPLIKQNNIYQTA
ncbi:uncharacterized protein LOC129596739 [Paramacrobiotus metropolitanus]|uniref:uncharacterized protein LOC129596739 n=1 Tax=Paramacrobiotus metropolitanus TaxID=2943436 RepID=UPI002445C317|nr:uncharacterized protein LOC129596739 [Paramacrobiotus metropolitanus]